MKKINLNANVMNAANMRIDWIFDTFEMICLSFSGGKDSTVLFHLMAAIAKKKNKKFNVLFIDWEAQYTFTIAHVENIKDMYSDIIETFYWVALPLTTVNGTSQYQPEWIAWENGVEWIRKPPECAITKQDYFPFYHYAMTFEEFVTEFSSWLAGKKILASVIGIRTDESLNRYLAITSKKKLRYNKETPWTTASRDGFSYNCYPIYDWRTQDIWRFNGKTKLPYNYLYDLMYQAGVPFKYMRVCEPFGVEQRRGLWLYHILEPRTWEKMCRRVCGAHSGSISGDYYSLNKKIQKPQHLTWKDYADFLLYSLPIKTSEHYRNKIFIYLKWYREHGYERDIPDEQDNDLGHKDIPSWRRICKTIIKNDFWCRTLSFSPTKKSNYERHHRNVVEKRKSWGKV